MNKRTALFLLLIPALGFAAAKSGKSVENQKPSELGLTYTYQTDGEQPEAPPAFTNDGVVANISKRKPASAAPTSDMTTLSTEMQALKSADDVSALITTYSAKAKFDKLSVDTQYFVLQLGLLKPFRGIIPRMRSLFEGENQAVHSAVVSQLKTMAASGVIYFPGTEWKALNEYLTVPDEKNPQPAITSVPMFQDFLYNKVAVNVSNIRNTMVELIKQHEKNNTGPFVFDNKALYGMNVLEDDGVVDVYTEHDFPEMWTAVSRMSMGLHSIYSFCAYNLNDGLAAYGSLAELYGKNAIRFLTDKEDLGVSSKDRTLRIRDKFPNFLTIRKDLNAEGKPFGKEAMKKSYGELVAAQDYSAKAFSYLKVLPENPRALIDPARFKSRQQQQRLTLSMNNINSVLTCSNKDGCPIHSPITGKSVDINLQAFFVQNPPADLKKLMPTGWDEHSKRAQTANAKIPYRYYKTGMPIAWDTTAWSSYLKPSKGSDMPKQYLPEALRTVRTSWGMKFLSRPIDTMVR